MSNPHHAIVFLVDIDNTLLDNDRIQQDIQDHLERELGAQCHERYWTIQEQLFQTLGYRDYLGAVQRFRDERPHDIRLLSIGSYLMNYPFADRLYLGALDVLRHLNTGGPAVILSDGDAVFQPRKAECSGIAGAAEERVLIYIHKEQALADVERRYPADHYVLVDDRLHILSAVKRVWASV
jgi:FMN phosphatase YigB (HAD superfamily)